MLKLCFSKQRSRSRKILCLGAHSDDIEIGCGGTILRMLSESDDYQIFWVVFAAKERRREEAIKSAKKFLANARKKEIIIKEFRESYFPFVGGDIKDFFEELKLHISPDLIFTHYRNDLHQDHRLISEMTWNTYRNHLILEYEIVKYDGDLGLPNLFVHLSRDMTREKITYLLRYFKSQARRDWFTLETFSSMLRIRGVESRAPEKFAEAFYCRKIIL